MTVIKKSETVDIQTEEEMVKYLQDAVKHGFRHIKIQVEKSVSQAPHAFRITIEKP